MTGDEIESWMRMVDELPSIYILGCLLCRTPVLHEPVDRGISRLSPVVLTGHRGLRRRRLTADLTLTDGKVCVSSLLVPPIPLSLLLLGSGYRNRYTCCDASDYLVRSERIVDLYGCEASTTDV
jgi:hypothetical protein